MRDPELSEPSFWILTSLAGGRRHGYAILQEVRSGSEGRFALKATTLYAALDRLTRSGLIAADGEEQVDGRVRRYFVLSREGVERLERETGRLETRARAARTRLIARPA